MARKRAVPPGAAAATPKPARKPRTPKAKPAPAPAAAPAAAAPNKPPPKVTFGRRMRRATSMFRAVPGGPKAGLGVLAGLGGAYGIAQGIRTLQNKPLIEQAQEDMRLTSRRQLIDQMSMMGRQAGLDSSIQTNLQRLQMEAPELYMRVAAGRRLPQGAVVLGGEKRDDLLQELGRSMSEGQIPL